MSTEAIVAANEARGLKPLSKLLLIVLAVRSDADDVCADDVAHLAGMTGMSPASVTKHLGLLAHDCLVYPGYEGEHSSGVLLDVGTIRRRQERAPR